MELTTATVQMACRPLAVEENLHRAEWHIADAHRRGAQLILLPELFNTGLFYDRRLHGVAEPIGGRTTKWLVKWSRTTGCHIGGAIAERSKNRFYDTFVLAAPDGEVFRYRKRCPAFFEKMFFHRGHRPGIFPTGLGRIGVLICWDMVHWRIVKRLASRIDFLVISAAWPDLRTGNILLPAVGNWISLQPEHRPHWLSKRLGVPVIFCNMTGDFRTNVPFFGWNYSCQYAGCSTIIDPKHSTAVRLSREEQTLVQTIRPESSWSLYRKAV